MRQGETQVASYRSSGASTTSRFLAAVPERAISRASAAAASMPALRQVVGGGEAPAAEGQHADSDAQRFGAGDVAGLAVLGGDFALARFDGADVGVGDAAPRHRVERAQGQVFHRGVISPPSLSCSPAAVRGKRVE